MLYRIKNGTVSAGGQTILSHIDFEIKGREKIAVVGRNGAGKTTLLRLIAGELSLDRDDKRIGAGIETDRELSIGYLAQAGRAQEEKTVEELLEEHLPEGDPFSQERFAYEREYDKIFTGLGFEKNQKKRRLSEFSGGEQTKILLIRELLAKPDILLLDEPTNHLDLGAVEWLEEYLATYEGAVVIVSHDRFFLDRVVNVVCELQRGRITCYPGNYTSYRNQRRKEYDRQKKAYDRQQAEIAHLNELIERFKHKPRKAAFARSRRTMLARMEKIDKPAEELSHIFVEPIVPEYSCAKWVVQAKKLVIGYDHPLAELSLRIKRGQKIGIIGDNGAGKSTFLRTVAGLQEPFAGECVLGERVNFGYFDQMTADRGSQGEKEDEKSVYEHYHDLFPGKTQKEVYRVLGAYLFRGTDAAKKFQDLSGGEKARLVIAELLSQRPNLLLLDEPTNHMDIPAKETLESAFSAYTGTLLFVSHDRYFIRQVADALLVFEGTDVRYYPFGYEHYLERKNRGDSDPAALLRAEQAALIGGLRAVPEAERHRLREIGTETAYKDWKLRLASEPLCETGERVAALEERRKELETERLSAEKPVLTESLQEEKIKRELLEQEEQWTRCCLEWYEVYLELF